MHDRADSQRFTVFEVARREDRTVLALRATEDLDGSVEQQCRDELLRMCRGARARWVLLFLGDRRVVDPCGLDVLLDASEVARSHGRHLVIIAPPPCLTRMTDRLNLGTTLCVATPTSQAVRQIFAERGQSWPRSNVPDHRGSSRPRAALAAPTGRRAALTEDRFPDVRGWGFAMTALLSSLTEAELTMARSTEPRALVDLDEDALLELHGRVRQARNKYLGQYRRQAAARVSEVGGRGKAYAQNQRARDKVEVFETALARVSSALAKAARRTAAELRSERLASTRRPSAYPAPPARRAAPATAETAAPLRPPRKSTGRRKRDASDIAIGRRNQARRDSR